MDFEYIQQIEQTIGYTFKNKDLLLQAFVRSSYAEENDEFESNQVLEFIGDKVLDVVIVGILASRYSVRGKSSEKDGHHWFVCSKNEGDLTEIKKSLVESKRLASVTERLGLHKFLLLGKGDAKNNIQDQAHVKEDLYEAIIGAVALDSDWNYVAITSVIDKTLDPRTILENGDLGFDYIGWVQKWWQVHRNGALPDYKSKDIYDGSKVAGFEITLEFDIKRRHFKVSGVGQSTKSAIYETARKAYDILSLEEGDRESPTAIIGKPDIEKAVNQLQELWQKKKIPTPVYDFKQDEKDRSWNCKCSLEKLNLVAKENGMTKAEAKKKAAYSLLLAFLNSAI